jgi:Janus/Ocnus family (Ocnus)
VPRWRTVRKYFGDSVTFICDSFLAVFRIEHEPAESRIFVYGYSMGFGLADHAVTVELLKAHYPSYTSITFSNDGY